LNPALLAYATDEPPQQSTRRDSRPERRISKRLNVDTVERLVGEYAAGTTAAEVGRRYGLARNSVLALVRQAGERVRHPRLSKSETAQMVSLYEAGLSQVDIAERLGRSPSAVWHCLQRAGLAGEPAGNQ
jgi:DNA-binding transcriptional regulator LsrR (DeoR family)